MRKTLKPGGVYLSDVGVQWRVMDRYEDAVYVRPVTEPMLMLYGMVEQDYEGNEYALILDKGIVINA